MEYDKWCARLVRLMENEVREDTGEGWSKDLSSGIGEHLKIEYVDREERCVLSGGSTKWKNWENWNCAQRVGCLAHFFLKVQTYQVKSKFMMCSVKDDPMEKITI